jgi:putative oxidoreductase
MSFFTARFDAQLYAVMRIAVGFTFLWHGMQKIFGFPVAAPEGMPAALLYVSGGIELVGGALVLVGFMTRQAAFLCSGLMAAAYWMAHGTNAVLPMMNQGELAYLYCFVFLFIAAHGSGIWAIDSKD